MCSYSVRERQGPQPRGCLVFAESSDGQSRAYPIHSHIS